MSAIAKKVEKSSGLNHDRNVRGDNRIEQDAWNLVPSPLMRAALPANNESRLEALRRYGILDTPIEADFEELTALASQMCQAPMSSITFVDENRQWFKSIVGMDARQTPLEDSICAHAILEDDFCYVPDTRNDHRTLDNPVVIGNPHLQFYAGAVLKSSEGHALGTLCVMDYRPRELAEFQQRALRLLARNVEQLLEIRRQGEIHRQISIRLDAELSLRKEILGIVAHDLRAPVSNIHLMTHVAEKEAKNGTTPAAELLEEVLGVLRDTVGDMDRLIGDLSEFSIAEEGRLAMKFSPCDPLTVIQTVEQRFRLIAQEAGISLTIHVADTPKVLLHADCQRLRQALGNFVGNAIRFTPSGGKVEVTLTSQSEGIHIVVRDTGCGIAAENLDKIFERFWTTGQGPQGTRGLGLAIARSIIDAHQGRITVSSGAGKGTTFEIFIPMMPLA